MRDRVLIYVNFRINSERMRKEQETDDIHKIIAVIITVDKKIVYGWKIYIKFNACLKWSTKIFILI